MTKEVTLSPIEYKIGVFIMNMKGLNKKLRTMNLYEIRSKIENGKKTSWMENALYAGFTPDEICRMVEDNL